MSSEITCPNGHPYVLFYFEAEEKTRFLLAFDTQQAKNFLKERYGEIEPRPVSISVLVEKNGRQKTHDFLKKIGETWVIKNGMCFFRQPK